MEMNLILEVLPTFLIFQTVFHRNKHLFLYHLFSLGLDIIVLIVCVHLSLHLDLFKRIPLCQGQRSSFDGSGL